MHKNFYIGQYHNFNLKFMKSYIYIIKIRILIRPINPISVLYVFLKNSMYNTFYLYANINILKEFLQTWEYKNELSKVLEEVIYLIIH